MEPLQFLTGSFEKRNKRPVHFTVVLSGAQMLLLLLLAPWPLLQFIPVVTSWERANAGRGCNVAPQKSPTHSSP
jgi:hypothetical protein